MSATQLQKLEEEQERLQAELALVEEAMDSAAVAQIIFEEVRNDDEPMHPLNSVPNDYLTSPPNPSSCCCTIC